MQDVSLQLQKVLALYDIWEFADLINFKGGRNNFGKVHRKFTGFITAPQQQQMALLPTNETTKALRPKKNSNYVKRRLMLAPRGHYKSTVSSTLYVLFRIYRNPNIRILVGANAKKLSQSFIRELRQYLEDPELQERVWNSRPHIEGRLIPIMDAAGRKRRSQKSEEETDTLDRKLIWTTEALQVLRSDTMKEPTVLATSYGTTVTGQHYDLLILDDVVDFRNSNDANKQEKVIEWVNDLDSVLDPMRLVKCGSHPSITSTFNKRTKRWTTKLGAPMDFNEEVGDEAVVLGTRYENGDLYDYLMQNMKDFKYRVFTRNIYKNGQSWVKPTSNEEEYKEERRKYVIGDDSKGYIFEERFTAEYFKTLKARSGTSRWASQYLNTIMNASEALFRVENLRYFKSADVKVEGGIVKLSIKDEEAPRVVRPLLTVDLASSQKATADNTVLTVGGMDEDGNLFVLDTKVGKFTASEAVTHFFELAEKWKVTKAVIETVGYQAIFVQLLKEEFKNHSPVFVVEHRPQGEKKVRLETGLQPYFENEKLFFADWMAAHSIIQDEIVLFPKASAKDDFLDTVDLLRQYSTRVPRDLRKLQSKQTTPVARSRWGGIRR